MMVSEGRGNPELVVNIEISRDGDLRERIEGLNVLYFGSYVVKEYTIFRGLREEIGSTDKFS
ncbi:hypothetical protein E2C01_053626 [Portunus trituberculatus]|uniref:Uncharacterized protein n=1 Tax=Portunus trituberculatus TaxID=210409 RepID=A0A5B7GKU4_PORTR|nr:hypothetical protein [Portunus trituberculatus]